VGPITSTSRGGPGERRGGGGGERDVGVGRGLKRTERYKDGGTGLSPSHPGRREQNASALRHLTGYIRVNICPISPKTNPTATGQHNRGQHPTADKTNFRTSASLSRLDCRKVGRYHAVPPLIPSTHDPLLYALFTSPATRPKQGPSWACIHRTLFWYTPTTSEARSKRGCFWKRSSESSSRPGFNAMRDRAMHIINIAHNNGSG